MISDTIIKDIFNVEHKATDVLVDHISDALEDRGLVVGDVENAHLLLLSDDLAEVGVGGRHIDVPLDLALELQT